MEFSNEIMYLLFFSLFDLYQLRKRSSNRRGIVEEVWRDNVIIITSPDRKRMNLSYRRLMYYLLSLLVLPPSWFLFREKGICDELFIESYHLPTVLTKLLRLISRVNFFPEAEMWRKGRSARYELTKQRSKNTVLYIQLWYSRCLTARWKPALISLGPKTPRRLSIISAHYCCREERKGEGASFESLVSERIRFCVPRTREREREIAGGTERRREKDGHNTLREIAGSSLGRRTVSWGISREWLVPVTTFDKRSRSAPTNPSIPIFRLEPWITIYIYIYMCGKCGSPTRARLNSPMEGNDGALRQLSLLARNTRLLRL